MNPNIAYIVIGIGGVLSATGLILLFAIIPWQTKKWETGLIMFAAKITLSLTISGLIIILLGVLYLMEILPALWWT